MMLQNWLDHDELLMKLTSSIFMMKYLHQKQPKYLNEEALCVII